MRKTILLPFILFLLLLTGCGDKSLPDISDKEKDELRMTAKDFMESLKTVLVKEMQTNGLTAAVSVCSDTAQFMTSSFGSTRGIVIKRVSFKNRNPVNSPDEFEEKGLKYFENLKNEGKLNEKTEIAEVVEKNNIRSIRYLKPIIVQAPCLNCHGAEENISPEVKKIISERYTDDKATGYSIGDLRGAVSVIKGS